MSIILRENRLLIGFAYAGIRTKLALIREAFGQLFTGSNVQKKQWSTVFTPDRISISMDKKLISVCAIIIRRMKRNELRRA